MNMSEKSSKQNLNRLCSFPFHLSPLTASNRFQNNR
jgi:hypothetical protein